MVSMHIYKESEMSLQKRIHQRLLIEELLRKRRSDDAERFAEVFRRSTVDPNPHQIEAAIFALQRLPEGGAMLCDEVGLGKTIEAGLVITEYRAQGKANVLIIVPLSLAGQWQVELQDLFSLRSTVVGAANMPDSAGRGIYIAGREFASTARGRAWLESKGPWDLVVVDEAHEIFANIYGRFSKKTGDYQSNLSKGSARRAAQVRALVHGAPILLLTATPLQNNLYELWGLLHYIDPESKVLGKFNEFCSLFVTGEGGRELIPEMTETLRRRLSLVLKRTLRRQAQPFIKQPFRERHVHTANFNPERAEADLHNALSRWLSKDVIAAYRRGHRALMSLQLRRRMASSPEALRSTLASVKDRMIKMRDTGVYPSKEDLDIEIENLDDDIETSPLDLGILDEDIRELEQIEKLAEKVVKAGADTKKQKLLEIINQISSRAIEGIASDKVVIFTESLRTLDSLRAFLEENGFAGEVTTFAGTNEGQAAQRALEHWQKEVAKFAGSGACSGAGSGSDSAACERGDASANLRAALVHEFKTRTRIFIATEAGAKGLNLQFCNCLINYDLPWNPQRIEQRIGRVHRYGQKHDVIIVNFINLSNEAEQRVYELLEKKLHVFTETLGASDTIINNPEIALNLESRINEMLDRCRTPEEIQEAFDRLNLELDAAEAQVRDERLANTKQLLADFDSTVQARLGHLENELKSALSHCDETLLEILRFEGDLEIAGANGPRTLVNWKGKLYHLGPPEPSEESGEPLHSKHADVQAVISRCLEETEGRILELDGESDDKWEFYKVSLSGFEQEECLLVVGASPYPDPAIHRTLTNHAKDLDSGILALKEKMEEHQRNYVDKRLLQMTARREDMHAYGDKTMAELRKKLEAADRARKTAASREATAKAQAQQTRIRNEIEKYAEESALEIKKRLQEMEEEERRLRLSQFVEASAQLLFTVKQHAKVGRA